MNFYKKIVSHYLIINYYYYLLFLIFYENNISIRIKRMDIIKGDQ